MRVEYINPFVEATFEILREILKTANIRRGELYLKKTADPSLGFATIIGLTGPASGRLVIDMTPETALKVATVMNEGEKFDDPNDEMVKATIGEVANMITGKAIAKLYKQGFVFALTPPTIVVGKEVNIETPKIETLVIPILTDLGRIELNIALKE